MRRADREVTSIDAKEAIIQKCKVCRIGMVDEGMSYIVPLNFGYHLENGVLTLFFHSAKNGRKLDVMKKNPKVCFEMDCETALKSGGDVACRYGFRFESIIGNGTFFAIESADEKAAALGAIMRHQTGREFDFAEAEVSGTAVFKIVSAEFSGKRNV